MARGQPKIEIEKELTDWQKAEYERHRTADRDKFRELCQKHREFLQNQEALVDFHSLSESWQLYIRYRLAEVEAICKDACSKKDNQKLINVLGEQLKLLEKLKKLLNDKNAFIANSLNKFLTDNPTDQKIKGKDFVEVLKEDEPMVTLDGTLITIMGENIYNNLLYGNHGIIIKCHLNHGKEQELQVNHAISVLHAKLQEITMKSDLDNIEINLKIPNNDFRIGMQRLAILEDAELLELGELDYLFFVKQRKLFKRVYAKRQAEGELFIAQVEPQLLDIRFDKESRQEKVRNEFKKQKSDINAIITRGKTVEEIIELKNKYQKNVIDVKYDVVDDNVLLPIPPNSNSTDFNLDITEEEVVVSTARVIVEGLSRLGLAASARMTAKTPQEFAGPLEKMDEYTESLYKKYGSEISQSTKKLDDIRKEILQLGNNINNLIKELE